MLKEQDLLLTDDEKQKIWVCGEGTLTAICKAQVDKALNLFKAEVDKLTVIDAICGENSHQLQRLLKYEQGGNEDVVLYWCNKCGSVQIDLESDGRFLRTIRTHKPQAQLQDTKNQLLDLMGE